MLAMVLVLVLVRKGWQGDIARRHRQRFTGSARRRPTIRESHGACTRVAMRDVPHTRDRYEAVAACGLASAFARTAPRNSVRLGTAQLRSLCFFLSSTDERVQASGGWAAAALASNLPANMTALLE